MKFIILCSITCFSFCSLGCSNDDTVFIRSQLDYFGLKSGTYSYGIRQNNQNNEVLFLNDSVQGIMLIHEDELKLAQGPIATFRR